MANMGGDDQDPPKHFVYRHRDNPTGISDPSAMQPGDFLRWGRFVRQAIQEEEDGEPDCVAIGQRHSATLRAIAARANAVFRKYPKLEAVLADPANDR